MRSSLQSSDWVIGSIDKSHLALDLGDLTRPSLQSGRSGFDSCGPVVWRDCLQHIEDEVTEPAYAERQTTSAIDKYALQLSSWLKTEAGKNRKQRRSLKQLHLELKELEFEGSYDRVAAFARKWKVDQTDRVSSASKRTSLCLNA